MREVCDPREGNWGQDCPQHMTMSHCLPGASTEMPHMQAHLLCPGTSFNCTIKMCFPCRGKLLQQGKHTNTPWGDKSMELLVVILVIAVSVKFG